ncbi:hypothetical protein [Flavobacterium sp. XS2P39]|uniref:hypothetical protein n=1 Tax=Flavobacterium sp. XS2P39 TaxID=3401725 RepID=UPI003AAD6FAD
MKQEFQTEFPQEITSVYFYKWSDRQEETVSGIDFFIEFKKVLPKNIKLVKIHFRNQVSSIEEVSKNRFLAHFYQKNKQQDLILDSDSLKEYGNKAPIIVKPEFDLKPNEALLEYMENDKTKFFKIINPEEKPKSINSSVK